ncbi:amino acid ABC transporter substrate-binding protein, PAAT family (TC 3.A.1.3.-) [Thermus arciformis]|uniref:Amino acid ABC transporter substrate-binding protein, PAAT family (TC 3.A.1.3.-) n=1 Tax=Thermus arciformis TaxID=482827 RepID=A0A1G7LDG6_9DEIN|nr:amino acid ABC transporter substrate-binding protein [Thermus arciformis]SDF47513.1 amino acid ABC transporter substrate-binding protein, PAAT family (TC 3.A.1.3.-) [Thermus arciformis]
MKLGKLTLGIAIGLLAALGPAWAQQSRLDVVKNRGRLVCGVNAVLPGFGFLDQKTGKYTGFDVEFCRAVAAALFGDPDKVDYVPLDARVRFQAVQNGEVDVAFRNTTVTANRDGALGVDFLPVTFYDGQGVMVKKGRANSLRELQDATFCTTQGTTNEKNITDYIRAQRWRNAKVLTFEDGAKVMNAFLQGRCDAFTADKSQLVGYRATAPRPEELVILKETISKEPLAGFVRENDSRWRDALSWIVYATIQAEEYGITQKNLDQFLKSEVPEIRRFLGLEGTLGQDLGLPRDFVVRVIRAVGNYGEIYDRFFGAKSPFYIPRTGTLNALQRFGGLMYSPPFR